MKDDIARKKLFEMIENGDLSAEEGLRLLNAFDKGDAEDQGDDEVTNEFGDNPQKAPNIAVDLPLNTSAQAATLTKKKKNMLWWLIPFVLGLILTVISAVWMFNSYRSTGLGWGFWLSWFPFGLGVFIMVFAAFSSKSKWIYIKVKEGSGEHPTNITLAFPLPIKLTSWFLKTFGHSVLKEKQVPLDSILEFLEEEKNSQEPFYVQVDDDEDHVEIYIG